MEIPDYRYYRRNNVTEKNGGQAESMNIEEIIEKVRQIMKNAIDRQASDIFIVAGRALTCKINGEMVTVGEQMMMPDETSEVIHGIYELAGKRSMDKLLTRDDDFSFLNIKR